MEIRTMKFSWSLVNVNIVCIRDLTGHDYRNTVLTITLQCVTKQPLLLTSLSLTAYSGLVIVEVQCVRILMTFVCAIYKY